MQMKQRLDRCTRLCSRLLAVLLAFAVAPAAAAESPRLVLFITIDQLTGDAPYRVYDRLPDGGFRYLIDNGLSYRAAHYGHATTKTAVGHATIATGGNASEHGMVANDWWVDGRKVYCVGDPQHTLLGADGDGISPFNLKSTTFGDELVRASGGKSRVFSVSIKDRGAVLPGGHAGKAFWYDKQTGRFVSSTYYYDELPDWAVDWNDAAPADRYADWRWELLRDRAVYTAGDRDDRPYELGKGSLGRTFPHSVTGEPADRYSTLRYTPAGDRMTLDFVKALFDSERVGMGDATDVLAISFSVTDYIGHAFGPDSLEAEDNLFRLDRTIADLLAFIDRRVPLSETLVILTSDHGVDAIPEARAAQGFEAGRHRPDRFLPQANAHLKATFDTEADLVVAFYPPGLYLDHGRLRELGLDAADVQRSLAAFMEGLPGFLQAFAAADVVEGRLPDTEVARRVTAAYFAERSGDVVLVQSPFWYLSRNPHDDAATHGSPYSYDTHVPILIAGPGIAPGTVTRPVAPRDIAPTISTYLDIALPSASVGNVLFEVFE
jgi:predicted AlkP superfamily pyrophosphatase or phosphodiesterase